MNVHGLTARRTVVGMSLVASGVVAGAALAAAGTANAADSTGSATTPSSTSTPRATRPAETALTGDVLAQVKAAVLAKYAGATFNRVETDSHGVYEAHIVTAAGDRITVEVNKAYAVTGTEAARGGDRGGHRRGGGKGGGAGETALTGDPLAKVKAAVLAKYAGASFTRVETDSDGVYEAHIVTGAGDKVTVELDKAYTITGTE
jgi:uncharacterized membrane protein YkoI